MSTRAGVFVLQGDQSIVAMRPAQFAAEDQFQDLIARFPMLLVGDQVDPEDPRRWVLVKREQSVGLDEVERQDRSGSFGPSSRPAEWHRLWR